MPDASRGRGPQSGRGGPPRRSGAGVLETFQRRPEMLSAWRRSPVAAAPRITPESQWARVHIRRSAAAGRPALAESHHGSPRSRVTQPPPSARWRFRSPCF
jgi:hypothetical protein